MMMNWVTEANLNLQKEKEVLKILIKQIWWILIDILTNIKVFNKKESQPTLYKSYL